MKHSTCFDIAVLEYGAKNKILKPLALFYSVKAKYRHSIIYNYTPRKLAKLTKLHPKTIERYVKKLESHGFIKHRDGHLLFVSRHTGKSPERIIEDFAQNFPLIFRWEIFLLHLNFIIIFL
jgi:hypothetical protein